MPAYQPSDLRAPLLLSTLPAPPVAGPDARLPIPLTSLVDRDHETSEIVRLLRDPVVHLVTLTGPGGVGKTRLAIAAATAVTDDFPDGVAFVRLAPVVDPDLVLATLAGALGLRDMGSTSLESRLVDALAVRRLLLVLDNVEQVVAAGTRLHDLLGKCPGVTLLVTSRIGLRLSGEHEVPVAPLSLVHPTTVADAGESGAVRLFTERARAVRPDFELTAETLPVVAEIVERVDGLPLAIELAAAWIRALPPAALLRRLEHRLPLLSGGPRDLPRRQRTMRETIAWSYDLLSPRDQALFRTLSVFSGGFTLAAATAVFAPAVDGDASAASDLATLEGVTSLIEQSVVRQGAASGDEPRYTMLETIREYARDRLDASQDGDIADGDIAHRRHAEHFLAFAEAADQGMSGAHQADGIKRLEADRDNLRAALGWLALAGEPETFLRLARALWSFWLYRGPYEEGRAWLEQALARGDDASPMRREALYALGLLAVNQDDVARAESCFAESLAVSRALGDPVGVAYGWLGLGLSAMFQQRFGQATTHLEEALAEARRVNDRSPAAVCAGLAQSFLGCSAYAQGTLPLATSRFEAALLEQREIDDRWGIGLSLVGLGYAARDQGDPARAGALFAEGLGLFTEVGDHRLIALALDGVAGLAIDRGEPDRAVHLLGAATVLRQASGLPVLPGFRATHERDVAAARAALGDGAFAAGWAAGAALPLVAAVAEATTITVPAPGKAPASPPSSRADLLGLTPRETEVLRLVAEGLTDREIAASLSISERTAGNHVQHILHKIDVDSRTAAAVYAVRHGLD